MIISYSFMYTAIRCCHPSPTVFYTRTSFFSFSPLINTVFLSFLSFSLSLSFSLLDSSLVFSLSSPLSIPRSFNS